MRIQSLQVLRAVAALMVVVLHATNLSKLWGATEWRFDLGAAGVDLFFVLSGVIITLIAKGSPAEFARRRIIRVVPFYFLMTLLVLPLGATVSVERALTTLTFWPAWGKMTMPILGIGWTLCFEMLFYAAATAILAERRLAKPIAAGYALCFLCLFWIGWPIFRFLGNPIILEFAAGALIGHHWKRGVRLSATASWVLVAAGVAMWALVPSPGTLLWHHSTLAGDNSLQRAFLIGTPAALIVWGALNITVKNAALVVIGDASYSIYLAHAVALQPFYFIPLPPWLRPYGVAAYLAIALIAAFVAYRYAEKPILVRLRLVRRAPAPAVSLT